MRCGHLNELNLMFMLFFLIHLFYFLWILGGWYRSIHSIWMDAHWYITLGIAHPRQKWFVHRIIGVCWRGHACHHHCILGMLRSIERIAMYAGVGECSSLFIPLNLFIDVIKTRFKHMITSIYDIFVCVCVCMVSFSSSASCWLYWWLRLQPAFMLTSIKINCLR